MQKFNILNLIAISLLFVGYFIEANIWYYVLLVAWYFTILTEAIVNVGSNFFVKTLNSKKNEVEKTICITFDDGPDPENTPKILKILNDFGCRATFFIIGKKIKGNEKLLEQIDKGGHLIGNHTFEHGVLFPLKSTARVKEEIDKANEEILKVTGKYPLVFRPPFGVTNPNIGRAVKRLGFWVLGWNIRSLDTKGEGHDVVLNRVIGKCQPGSVVLFHDRIPETARVLTDFLVFLKQNEYKVILPDEMFGIQWYKNEEV